MIFPVQTDWRLTADFKETRPLSLVERLKTASDEERTDLEARLHPHGAWDIGVPVGTPFVAPEKGKRSMHFFRREKSTNQNIYWPDGTWYALSNYFFDIWGCVVTLQGESGYTHVFVHIDRDWFFKEIQKYSFDYSLKEGKNEIENFIVWDAGTFKQDEVIGLSGNSGYSFGPHIHYEMHHGKQWVPHQDRPDPRLFYPGEWREHKRDLGV